MARKRVTVTFQPAAVTPSKRAKRPVYEIPIKTPKGLTPLAAYVEENRESGLSVAELIAQFQEYDCEHRQTEKLANTNEKITTRCLDCGMIQTKFKPGVKA